MLLFCSHPCEAVAVCPLPKSPDVVFVFTDRRWRSLCGKRSLGYGIQGQGYVGNQGTEGPAEVFSVQFSCATCVAERSVLKQPGYPECDVSVIPRSVVCCDPSK